MASRDSGSALRSVHGVPDRGVLHAAVDLVRAISRWYYVWQMGDVVLYRQSAEFAHHDELRTHLHRRLQSYLSATGTAVQQLHLQAAYFRHPGVISRLRCRPRRRAVASAPRPPARAAARAVGAGAFCLRHTSRISSTAVASIMPGARVSFF